jgi:hypothetical protein
MTERIVKPSINFNRTNLLILVLVLKVVPLRWIYSISSDYEINYSKITSIVHNALLEGLLSIKESYPGEKFLFLTKKGYNKAEYILPANYGYTSWSKGAKRTETIFRHHHYLTFRFVLNYLSEYSVPQHLYIDYDKNCKLGVKLAYHTYYAYPDCIIRPADEDKLVAIVLESDTGKEEIKKLFDKLLRYFIIAHHRFDGEDILQLKIYFTFNSEQRRKSVFGSIENDSSFLYKLFEQGTRLKFYKDKMPETLGIRDFFKVVKLNQIELYHGVFNQSINQYQKEVLPENILSNCPDLKKLYEQVYPT